ncbi:LacI family transcriptional regulator [Streptacidiphilus sp. PB12-B1b]|uniref:LacI family DNA-binding transcriptional regulator n=1 Tax=Streptacidiphilus sp. PB12-B1b TaxID=2705012 RepID=UPI0015F93602|nr:LacI family DNA-binding transcriptional regulator [Streptacidiphilus sp. PB12-B1b]QMU77538.1 LacI family transcriptional regulator [Streptacidiphilus sp. PB12-B1b]
MPITIADVAAHAGVSKTTVSRVLNGKGELNAATAARVRQVIEELGYVPSAGAVGLARGRTQIVGMLVPSMTWPWIGEVLQGVVDVVESEGFGLLLFTCNRGEQSLRRFAQQVSAKSFDGLLVIEPEGTLDYITELHAAGLPVVLIDDRGHQPLFPSVATTDRAGGASAARHLLELGRRRPLVITGPTGFGCVQERLAGFTEAWAESGPPLTADQVVAGDFTFEGGRSAVRRLLDHASGAGGGVPFDAVFAHNDLSAAGALAELRAHGLRVPQQVAVVGFDDVPLAAQSDPGLTTVHQPLREMGSAAARLLLAHFRGEPLPSTPTVLPTSLVVRGSTRPGR